MTTFTTAVWDAIKAPDAWDLGGLGFASAEESWKRFGELVGKMRTGDLSTVDAQKVKLHISAMAQSWSTMAARVSAINVPATTGAEYAVREIAPGNSTSIQKFSTPASHMLKYLAGYLDHIQFSKEFKDNVPSCSTGSA